ncbi:MAG: pyruvate, phosphate dikinase [Nitrospirae bacterium]|nr:pyruvate, phosphate dikinase [Nitrospirota bacterium]
MSALFKGSIKKNVCLPLTNIKGSHVRKYRYFRYLLGHNQAALNAMSSIEQLYYGGNPYSLEQVRFHYETLLEAVSGIIYSLEKISGKTFAALANTTDRLDKLISEHLSPDVTPIKGGYVISFDQLKTDMSKAIGAKAANLALIRNVIGLPVPDGFAVSAHAFDSFITGNKLTGPIRRELSRISPETADTLEEAGKQIQAMIMDAEVPEKISREIVKAYDLIAHKAGSNVRIAMRSSAIGEDTEATFAGQYRTELNVGRHDLDTAYKTIVASKYSGRAIAYRLRYGLSDRETPMCVAGIVMLNSHASGVMYTGDSSAMSDTITIASLWGLGERLVDGSAPSDVFTVARTDGTIIRKEISRKNERLVISETGSLQTEEVPDDKKEMPSINDRTIFLLHEHGLALEKYFGGPQDVEWALDGNGNLFILQSRPLSMQQPAAWSGKQIDSGKYPVIFSKGKTASSGTAVGKAFIMGHDKDLSSTGDGLILVAGTASPEYAKLIGKVKGIITDIGSPASHLSSVAREFGIPMIVDARDAMSLLTDGEMITMSADTATVYRGIVDELIEEMRPARKHIFESPVHNKTRRILDSISPLTLTDPSAPSFIPEACRTIHDIIRYAHEGAMKAMFGITDEAEEVRSIKLTAKVPLDLRLIDLGGGLRAGLTTCHEVTPEQIESFPMNAIWKGFTHPGIKWEGTINLTTNNLMTLFASSAISEIGEMPGGISYAIISRDYMNLSAKFGYHFTTIDAMCSENSNQNYVSIQFAGGAGNYYGKALRISLLRNVLSRLGFQVSMKGDLLDALISGYDRPALEDKLDQLGRLFAASRLLDMTLSGRNDVDILTEAFFNGTYDFLSIKRADELKEFYTHGGYWKRTVEDGHAYCVQDSSKEYVIASGTAGIAGKIIGSKVQELLDNIEAYYYFPLAIVRNGKISDGTVSVMVKPMKGHIDRAGGIAFGIRNSSNYYVIRINALEDNVILFEYVNGKRRQRMAVNEKIHSNIWYNLSVQIRGSSIRGFIDNRPVITYTTDNCIKGFIGLWTKADSVTWFDNLTIETEGRRQIIEF